MKDIEAMITHIKKRFHWVDTSKILMMGHSMGAMTAIEACKRFPEKLTACVALDPYFLPRRTQLLPKIKPNNFVEYSISQPLAMISNEFFHATRAFNSAKALEVL